MSFEFRGKVHLPNSHDDLLFSEGIAISCGIPFCDDRSNLHHMFEAQSPPAMRSLHVCHLQDLRAIP